MAENDTPWGSKEELKAIQAQSKKEWEDSFRERYKDRIAKGKPLPIPEPENNSEMNDGEEAVKAVRKIVDKFEVYVNQVKQSNQNFLLKAGKIILADVRSSMLAGLADAQEQENATGSGKNLFSGMEDMMLKVNKNLDKMIKAQTENNKLVKKGNEEDRKENRRRKKEHDDDEEDRRESLMQRAKNFFYKNEDGEKGGILGKGIGKGMEALGSKFMLIAELAQEALPLLVGGIALFFVDFKKLGENPVWGKLSSLITDKIIPAVSFLFTKVIGPLANFLVNTTLPALLDGLVDIVNEFSDLITDVTKAFSKGTWEEKILGTVKAIGKFIWDSLGTILSSVAKAIGIDPKEELARTYADFKHVIDSVVTSFSKIWDSVQEEFEGLFEMAQGIIHGNIKEFFEGFKKYTVGAIKTIFNIATGVINAVVNFFMDFLHWNPGGKPFDITEKIEDLVTVIGDWFKDGIGLVKKKISSIGSYFSDIYNGVIDLASTISSSIMDKIKGAKDSVIGWFEEAGSFSANLLKSAVDGMMAMKNAIIDSITNTLTGAKDSLAESLKEGSDLLTSLKDKIMKGFWGLMDSLANATVSALKSVSDFIKTIPEKLKDYIFSVVSSAKNIIPEKIRNLFGAPEPTTVAVPNDLASSKPNASITEKAKLANMAAPVGQTKPTVALFKESMDKFAKEQATNVNTKINNITNVNASRSSSSQTIASPIPYNSRPSFGGR